MEAIKYSCSKDLGVKIVTYTLVCFTILTALTSFFSDVLPMWPAGLTGTIFLTTIIIGCYLYAPKSYELTNDALMIHRPAGYVVIQLTDIDSVKVLQKEDTGFIYRTFGVGGLFGYYGRFASSRLGKLTLYTTRRDHKVMLQLKTNQKIIITPDSLMLATQIQQQLA